MTKEQKFWSWILFLPLLIGILWLILGAFSMLWASQPYTITIDEKDRVYFNNSANVDDHWGLENYTYDYVNNWLRLRMTIAQNSSSVADWGVNYRISDKDPSVEEAIDKITNYAFSQIARPNTNWFTCELQFSATGVISTCWIRGTSEIEPDCSYPRTDVLEGIELSDYIHISNTYPDPPNNYTMTFTPRPIYIGAQPRVWGITPASETEITDLDTTFEFGWEGLDLWDTLSIVFKNRPTGIFTTGKEFLIEEIGTSGEMELNLEDFDFDRNGKFYFFATATKVVPEIIEGMYLTGRQSIEFSDDLVDPEYYLTINVEGYTPIFEMENFLDWYSVKAKFDEPTEMFEAIAGFFEPVFNKIGEFGNRIKDYFNVNESYTQGYEIGKAIPYFTYFVGRVDLLLGGFPIMKWLFVIILLLTGIFIFRLILKFIPFLG